MSWWIWSIFFFKLQLINKLKVNFETMFAFLPWPSGVVIIWRYLYPWVESHYSVLCTNETPHIPIAPNIIIFPFVLHFIGQAHTVENWVLIKEKNSCQLETVWNRWRSLKNVILSYKPRYFSPSHSLEIQWHITLFKPEVFRQISDIVN